MRDVLEQLGQIPTAGLRRVSELLAQRGGGSPWNTIGVSAGGRFQPGALGGPQSTPIASALRAQLRDPCDE